MTRFVTDKTPDTNLRRSKYIKIFLKTDSEETGYLQVLNFESKIKFFKINIFQFFVQFEFLIVFFNFEWLKVYEFLILLNVNFLIF